MAVPLELVGAWRRSGLIFDGLRRVDYCDVMWLQTPDWFVDIRLLIDRAVPVVDEGVPAFFYKEFAFAGVTTWEPPQITWNHKIDSNLEPAVDSNPLTWKDGVVFETGKVTMNGREIPFIEEWLRTTDDTVRYSAEVGEREARIEVGRWAVEIKDERPAGKFKATRYEADGTGWRLFGSVEG
jgi:Protein HRI1